VLIAIFVVQILFFGSAIDIFRCAGNFFEPTVQPFATSLPLFGVSFAAFWQEFAIFGQKFWCPVLKNLKRLSLSH
jgi:hypothetical protein